MKISLLLIPVLFLSACITINQGLRPGENGRRHRTDTPNGVAMRTPYESENFVDPVDGVTYKWAKVRVTPVDYRIYSDRVLPHTFQPEVKLPPPILPTTAPAPPPAPVSPASLMRATPVTGSFKDERDGQVYQTVTIGKQTWMSQNLNYKTTSRCQDYNDDPKNGATYGKLYNYNVLAKACPKGWHIPTDAEWEELEYNVGMSPADTSRQQFRGDSAPNFFAGGASKMNILFAGQWGRGKYSSLDESAYFWTSTRINQPITSRIFRKGDNRICKNQNGEGYNLSVRCVKDTDPKLKKTTR